MWISKEKYEALVARLDALERKSPEELMIDIDTGKTERAWSFGCGFMYDKPITVTLSVKDAIHQIIKAAGVCIDYTPPHPEVKASIAIKKCDKADKKGK